MSKIMKFDNKVVIVTGVSSGIGRIAAEKFTLRQAIFCKKRVYTSIWVIYG